jgi:acyl carrier protein
MVSVDAEAIEWSCQLARESEGLEVCPASALTIAGARQLARAGRLRADALVLLNLTGVDRAPSARRADFIVARRGDGWALTPGAPSRDGVVDAVIEELRRSQQLPDDLLLDAGTVLLEKGLALDSVGVLELLLALETRFGRPLEEHELTKENLETVGALAQLVSAKLARPASPDA